MIQQDVFDPHGETDMQPGIPDFPRLTLKSLGVLAWVCHQTS